MAERWVKVNDDNVIVEDKEKHVKKSGCRIICESDESMTTKNGKTFEGLFMSVWKIHDGVYWKGKIFRNKDQKKNKPTVSNQNNDKKSKQWIGVTLVMSAPMHNDIVQTGVLDLETYKVYFKNWNMIANPKGGEGGYFGKHISKKYDK